jgi:PPK2 family polyphosphate:nucleotide phosphotransferase
MPKYPFDRYRVKPGAKVRLKNVDADSSRTFMNGAGDKAAGRAAVAELNLRLESLQELLFAERKHKFLVVLQAMDTGGKDGVISSVFEGVNPLGCKVVSFGRPTQPELDHDYLWRVHNVVPAKGEMTIFNRSHYEDVLVVRVDELVPKSQWSKRYRQIVEFERMLFETGTTILKFYLHIDKNEQKQRLQARLDDPAKHWKFRRSDLAVRAKWDAYMDAYDDVLEKTSTEHAPWYVVPANKKWYRDWVIANVIVDTLTGLKMQYPSPEGDLSDVVIE